MKPENISYYFEGMSPTKDSHVLAAKVLQEYEKLFPKSTSYKWVFQNRGAKFATKLTVIFRQAEDLVFDGIGKDLKSSIQNVIGKIEEYIIECELCHTELLKEKKSQTKALKDSVQVR